ncbi:lipase/acylhydrolase family protein [Microbacterium esteraromaticum]|uniref:Lipase/acylhydrolase family protein n=1 Tax=Microbacterium esteraromaticum TaxID=57043 RepID=A0A1R4IPU9_9MICO|nr:SGNH/GDSL hydrolase family protein [Microbacterium esteraromaticum]SJN21684.1 lipase/acylhydrolase family protein [Microbacterium esteraromaticum]
MNDDLQHLRTALAADDPLVWVMTGDSITHGLTHTGGERNYVDHLHELIRGDMARVRDTVINTAISGWRIVLLLEDFEQRVARWQPDVVTLMVGTNDCSDEGVFPVITAAEFGESVTEFVRRVRAIGAIPVLQTQPGIDVKDAPERARIAEFAQTVREVAARDEVILVDQFARFAELGGGDIAGGLLNDPFHPNAAGQAVLALEFARTLGLAPTPERDRVLPDLAVRGVPRP